MLLLRFVDAFGETGRPASHDEGAVPPNATLQIALELVSWKAVSDITKDKKVLKKILKEGEGYERPNDGAVVQGITAGNRTLYPWHFKFLNVFVPLKFCNCSCLLLVKLIGKLHDGTIFTKKGHDEEPFEFKIDEGNNSFFPICNFYISLSQC